MSPKGSKDTRDRTLTRVVRDKTALSPDDVLAIRNQQAVLDTRTAAQRWRSGIRPGRRVLIDLVSH